MHGRGRGQRVSISRLPRFENHRPPEASHVCDERCFLRLDISFAPLAARCFFFLNDLSRLIEARTATVEHQGHEAAANYKGKEDT